jgi:hypothetical protein
VFFIEQDAQGNPITGNAPLVYSLVYGTSPTALTSSSTALVNIGGYSYSVALTGLTANTQYYCASKVANGVASQVSANFLFHTTT